MPSSERKSSLIVALVALSLLVIAPACTGFFVNAPNSVTVTPSSPSLVSKQQQSFVAQAAFSNSTKNVTASSTWTTSNPCVVAIITSGANAGNATDVGTGGSATITASYNGVSGTATASVPTGLTINPCPEQAVGNFPEVVYKAGGPSATFTANGATGTVTWSSDNTSAVSITSTTGVATFPAVGTATITATTSSETGTLFITVQ